MADEVIKTVLTADDAEFRASFERAASTLKKHEARLDELKKKSLARVTEELKALKLEAGGQKAAADALRETMSLREKALVLAKQTGLSEQASMVLLQKRAALEKQVAAESVRRSQPVSLSGLPVNNLQDLDKLNRVAAQSAQHMNRLRSGGQNASMGLLEISRAAEDAQYGLRGVINNVPGIVQSFGGSAGIAGAVSLAVVAFYQLGKAYMAYLDSIDNGEAFRAGQAARDEALKSGREQLRVLRQEEGIRESINALAKDYSTVLDRELGMQKGLADVIDGRMEQTKRARELADELAAAEDRLATARGAGPANRSGVEIKRLEEDLGAQTKLLEAINMESERQSVARANYTESLAGQIEADLARLDAVRASLVETEARMQGAAAQLAGMKKPGAERAAAQQNLKTLTDQRNAVQTELKTLEARVAALQQQAEDAASKGTAGSEAIDARISSTMGEIRALKELIELRKKVADIDSQAKEEARLNEELKKRRELLAQVKREEQDRFDRFAEQQKRMKEQAQAQVEFGGEIKALRLEASGRKDLADALRTELRIREEAASLAERTGISEDKATAMVRERERLLRQIREGDRTGGGTGSRESKIRTSARNEGRRIEASYGRKIEAAGGRTIEAAGWRRGSLTRSGLRESELSRQAQVKAMANRETGEAKAAKYWERSIDLQETMLKVFKEMGAI